MKVALAEYDFTGKNLTSEVQINADWTTTALLDVLVDVVLGITGGRIAGAGATYTLVAKITRTIAGTAETLVLAKEQWVDSQAASVPIQCSLRFPVQPGDVVKLYATSTSASDSDVDGAIYYSAYNDLASQEIRDAMNLAPTPATVIVGSIDAHLDDLILSQTSIYSTLTSFLGLDGNAILSTDSLQNIRDALKLAPSVGASASGSIDSQLSDLKDITQAKNCE